MRLSTHLLRSLPLAAALLLIPTTFCLANVPSPGNSSHDPCLVLCPFGDIPYNVTVRDLANVPISGSLVVLDFSQCAFIHCPADQQGGAIVDEATHSMRMFTDASGHVQFHLAMGGCCPSVKIFADGVLLGTVSMSSPDQDGSLFVNGADAAILAGLMGTSNSCGDLSGCDGLVNAADGAVLNAHMGHTCGSVVPARPQSWGKVKTIYR